MALVVSLPFALVCLPSYRRTKKFMHPTHPMSYACFHADLFMLITTSSLI